MPLGYEYRCDGCDHQWLLFSTRLTLGPTQWSHVDYTCFTCQTFLKIAKQVDRSSWSKWMSNNQQCVDENATLARLASEVDRRLAAVRGITPIELDFEAIPCPTCSSDLLRDTRFGQHPMRCPRCREYAGLFIPSTFFTIYEVVDPSEEVDKS